jgi:hypothetical protein
LGSRDNLSFPFWHISCGTLSLKNAVPLLSAAIKIFHTAAVINHWHLGNKGRADMEVPSVTGIQEPVISRYQDFPHGG